MNICTHCHQKITQKEVYENEIGETEYVDEGHLAHCCRNWTVDCPHRKETHDR